MSSQEERPNIPDNPDIPEMNAMWGKGEQGVQGIQGVQGHQGEQGVQGLQGVAGSSKLADAAEREVTRLIKAKSMPKWVGRVLGPGVAEATGGTHTDSAGACG